ncbi:iron-containing alcohol dehydrogenase, partial [Vibrio parahaemolyticus]|nr:iron-containing alcohol dehydrogenase [Vibrio parahaemolyticus]
MLKHRLYRTYTAGLKIAALILPMPRPTLFSGPGSMNELLESMTELGFKRALLVTDEGLVQVGIVDKVLEAAAQLDLQLDVFSQVKPDPTYDQVESGLEAYHRFHCEGILALGGGSAMDCAKVIAAKVTNKRPIKKLAGLLKVWRMPAPLFAIPTTAGTGSEVTIAAVVSDPSSHIKTPLMDPKLV